MEVFSEDDWIAEVEVLENTSDEQWEKYTLKVVRTIRESKVYRPTPDGTVFHVAQKKNAGVWTGMWCLRDSAKDYEVAT